MADKIPWEIEGQNMGRRVDQQFREEEGIVGLHKEDGDVASYLAGLSEDLKKLIIGFLMASFLHA